MRFRLLILAIVLSPISGRAQNWQLGPELGVNCIQLENSHTGKTFAAGWHAGGFVQSDLTSFFSIRSGVFFTQKKQLYESADTSIMPIFALIGLEDQDQFDLNTYTSINGRTTQNYLEIPLIAKFKYNGIGVFAGVYGAFMLNSIGKQIKISNTPILSVINTDSLGAISSFLPPAYTYSEEIIENASNRRKFDFGAKFGASYQFERLELNLTYSLGILDYRQNFDGLSTQKHQYFQFSLAYNIGSFANSKSIWKSNKLK